MSLLDALSAGGITALTREEAAQLREQLWNDAAETGEARFALLARIVSAVDAWMNEHEESGGVPAERVEALDALFRSDLPAVMAAPTPSKGSLLARQLLSDVRENLGGTYEWGFG